MFPGLHEKCPFYCQILMKLEPFPQIVENYSKINFHDNRPGGAQMLHADGWPEEQT